MARNGKDRMQVAAFHSIYKSLRRRDSCYQNRIKARSREEDFCEAIVLTCDDVMKHADPVLIKQWLAKFDNKGSRNGMKYKKKENDEKRK